MNLDKVWFISDTHFGHDRVDENGNHIGVITFERHKFKTIEEHDSYLINMLLGWAKNHANDGYTLFHLGDFGKMKEYIWVIKAIREYGIEVNFVVGNHDKRQDVIEYASYFDNIYYTPQYIAERVIVSHEPQYPVPFGVVNIHGHLHGAILDSDQHVNVSIAVINYNMISGKAIIKKLSKLPKADYKFLKEPYADKYVFTQKRDDVVCKKDTNKIDLPATLAKKKVLDNS